MTILKRLLHLSRRRQFEQDLADEVRFHREMAGSAFGSVALTLEDSRAVWSFRWLDSLLQDFRYALRGFRKTPSFALTIIGTIGLGLGLNTTLFTVFNAYVLRPIAVRDPYSLYTFLWNTGDSRFNQRFTWPDYQELRRQQFAFSESLAYQNGLAAMAERGSLVQVVSGNYFTMLGVGMSMGRPILEADAVPGSPAVAVASYATWQNRFAADPNILGKKIYLRGVPVEVVGVARPEFLGLDPFPAEFWVPLPLSGVVAGGPDLFSPDRPARLTALLRLKPGVTPQAARSALLAWSRQATADRPPSRRVNGIFLELHATPIALGQNAVGFAPIFAAGARPLRRAVDAQDDAVLVVGPGGERRARSRADDLDRAEDRALREDGRRPGSIAGVRVAAIGVAVRHRAASATGREHAAADERGGRRNECPGCDQRGEPR